MNRDNNTIIPNLDMESKDWLKLEHNMKTFGFQEGAAKGREATLQEGFNEGFSAGFKMGVELGIARGVLSCAMESGFQRHFNFDEQLTKFFNESCILCQNENNKKILEEKLYNKSFTNIISEQQKCNDNILKNIKIFVSNSEIERNNINT